MNDVLVHVKLDRRCPRCHAHHYHFANRELRPDGLRQVWQVTIDCTACGHRWIGRYRKDEWT